eukprot:1096070-Pleurochrysis_carterae.AAC.1
MCNREDSEQGVCASVQHRTTKRWESLLKVTQGDCGSQPMGICSESDFTRERRREGNEEPIDGMRWN